MLLSQEEELSSVNQVQLLPPLTSTSVHAPVPLTVQGLPADFDGLPPSFASAGGDQLRLESLAELLERLDLESVDALRKYTKKVFHSMVDSCKNSIQGRSRDDVQLCLNLMDDQWRNDKLSEMVRIKLGSLASALKNEDIKEADKIHLTLIVDHIMEVSQWMVGVKRIIYELKRKHHSSSHPSTPRRFVVPSSSSSDTSTCPVPMTNGVSDNIFKFDPAIVPHTNICDSWTDQTKGTPAEKFREIQEQHQDVR